MPKKKTPKPKARRISSEPTQGVTVQRRAANVIKKWQERQDRRKSREDFSQAAFRVIREATEKN